MEWKDCVLEEVRKDKLVTARTVKNAIETEQWRKHACSEISNKMNFPIEGTVDFRNIDK